MVDIVLEGKSRGRMPRGRVIAFLASQTPVSVHAFFDPLHRLLWYVVVQDEVADVLLETTQLFLLYASRSGGCVRRLSSTPDRKRSCHSSSSATVRPCFRAAAWAGISPRKIFETSAERGFAVERLACFADVISHLHLAYSRMASGWVGFHGEHVVRLRWL